MFFNVPVHEQTYKYHGKKLYALKKVFYMQKSC